MSDWLLPELDDLRQVIAGSEGDLLLCSPFVSTPALSVISSELPQTVDTVEFWTKLDARDWLTGSSDPEGLLDFLDQVEGRVDRVSVRHARHLHAKMIVSDGSKAIAGSANLTAGGFMRNLELVRIVTGNELDELRQVADSMRPQLSLIPKTELEAFVAQCTVQVESKEALLELIREEMPSVELNQSSIMPYNQFLTYLRSRRSRLSREILTIATNADNNNNTGKVKQAFFGVQRFLQEYPHHRDLVEGLSVREWFDVMQSELSDDWLEFLDQFSQEVNTDFEYSIPTLRGYLPRSQGGTLVGGGGGSNELKRVWPYVGRALRVQGNF